MKRRVMHFKSTEKRKGKKWFIRVCLMFGALYFLMMVGVTIYAQAIYVRQLPAMKLVSLQSGDIDYILTGEAELTENGVMIRLDLSARIFPVRALQSGCPVTLTVNSAEYSGTLTKIAEQSDYVYELTIDADTGGLPQGTKAMAEITCETVSFQNTIDRSLIFQNIDEKDVIYMVVQQDGPWGKQYVLKENEVSFWPEDGGETVALMLLEELSYPIARPVDPDLYLYSGMEVQLVS